MDEKETLKNFVKKQKTGCEKQSSIQQKLNVEVYEFLEKIFRKKEFQDIDFKISTEYQRKTYSRRENLDVVVEVFDSSYSSNEKTSSYTQWYGEFLEVENEGMKTNDVKSFVDCEEEN